MNNSVYDDFFSGALSERERADVRSSVYAENSALISKRCLEKRRVTYNVIARDNTCVEHLLPKYQVSLASKYSALLESADLTLGNYKKAQELLYHWEGNHHGKMASVYAVFFIERNYASMNLEAINDLLLTASVKRLTEWSMVAMLRASFSAKQSLPAWYIFYDQVKFQLRDNPRVSRLLAGLDD